jgi:hypothetical protein
MPHIYVYNFICQLKLNKFQKDSLHILTEGTVHQGGGHVGVTMVTSSTLINGVRVEARSESQASLTGATMRSEWFTCTHAQQCELKLRPSSESLRITHLNLVFPSLVTQVTRGGRCFWCF